MAKLTYKILGRRTQTVSGVPQGTTLVPPPQGMPGLPTVDIDLVDVEWTCSDGPVQDTIELPTTHPPIHPNMPPIQYKTVPDEKRTVIKDQVNVPHGASDSLVMQILDEKRKRLAENLNIKLDS